MLIGAVFLMLTGAVIPAQAGQLTPNPNNLGNTIMITGNTENDSAGYVNDGTITITSSGTLNNSGTL
jgi:hypothetical protein